MKRAEIEKKLRIEAAQHNAYSHKSMNSMGIRSSAPSQRVIHTSSFVRGGLRAYDLLLEEFRKKNAK